MCQIKAGVSRAEYCATLSMLIEHNWKRWTDRERDAAAAAWHAHC